MERDEKAKKMLRFSPTAKENATFAVLGKPHTSALRKLWFERCRSNQHEKFEEDLARFSSKGLGLRKFYEREGWTILNRAINNSISSKELSHICKFMPEDSIVKIVCEDHYSILRAFMLGATAIERNGQINPEGLAECYEKIQLLVGLRSTEIGNYLEKMVNEDKVGEKVKIQLKRALTNSNLKP